MYRTVIPEEGKTKWAVSCYTTLLPRERFQAVVQGGGTQTELSSLADLKRQSMQLGEAKATRVYRTAYRRGKSYTKSSETYSGITWHCWIMTCHMWESTKARKRATRKQLSGTIATVHTGPGTVHVKASKTKKGLITHKVSSKSMDVEKYCLRKVLPQLRSQISHRPKTVF